MPDIHDPEPAHVDVVIIGAGLSGIGAAHHLLVDAPEKTFIILEAREALGGTWDLFRYPGIRSDSDLSTFSYEFRPWRQERSIAPASMILDYLRDTAGDEGIDKHIRYSRRVTSLRWSSAEGRWSVRIDHADTGESSELHATWVFCAGGYYRYDEGYSPVFDGTERFHGEIVHPQFWPDGLDYTGKRVVVIGSGATAMTLVPAMAPDAAHVTMLQRTPSYVAAIPSVDRYAVKMRRKHGDARAHHLARRRNIRRQRAVWWMSKHHPALMRRLLIGAVAKRLPDGYPVDIDFTPPYDPWDQRLCAVPDGDLFTAIRSGSVSIVTDRIRAFSERGVLLESGREIAADLIVTATGLNVQLFGGVSIIVDGVPVVPSDHVAYRGMMLDGVPNFAYAIGYTNSSWTLKIGLLCEYFTRLLQHMDEHGYAVCRPELPERKMETRPLLDFGAGYVKRSVASLPRQGDRAPWVSSMDYYDDVKLMREAPVDDGALRFAGAPHATPSADHGEGENREQLAEVAGGVRICWRADGPEDGRPLLLIAGIGLDLHSWQPTLVAALTEAGFRVIRFDNRDSGRSSRGEAAAPGAFRRMIGRATAGDYALEDLAADTIGLLDHLGIESVDVVGMSMGGMIAQILASQHPDRIRSLTSIFSNAGDGRFGKPAIATVLALSGRPASDADDFARGYLALQRHIADGPLGVDYAAEGAWARRAWERMAGVPGFVPGAGLARQIMAIKKSGNRTGELRRITAPTLVVHGDRDLMVAPSGGTATARAIAGATLVTITGLRHHLPASATPRLARLIIDHAVGATVTEGDSR